MSRHLKGLTEPSMVLAPPAGTGLLFCGDVMHAGMPVQAGAQSPPPSRHTLADLSWPRSGRFAQELTEHKPISATAACTRLERP